MMSGSASSSMDQSVFPQQWMPSSTWDLSLRNAMKPRRIRITVSRSSAEKAEPKPESDGSSRKRIGSLPVPERKARLARVLSPECPLSGQVATYASSTLLYTFLAGQVPALQGELERRKETLALLLKRGYLPDSFLRLLAIR